MAYIQAAQRAVRYTAPAQQAEVQQTYRKWLRNYDGEKQKDEAERTWEKLSQQKKWLHWEEVIEVVKSQRDEYESASTGLTQAKESVRYALLLFYSCLPPGRAQEYRTLKFERCRQDDLRPTAPTPENKKSNVLFITDEGDRASPAHKAAHAPPSATTHPAKQTPLVSRSPQRRAPSRSSYPATSTTSPGNWSSTLSPVDIAPFVQPVGPTVAIPESELDVFGLFFTDEICGSITEQTNLYAQQVLGEKYGEWKKVTVEELRAYFGFMLLMGLYPKPATSDYWRRDPFVNYAPIADRIPRDRFYEIQRYLHFADISLLS